MQIGTIVSDASITVQMRNGRKLGHVEESFIARLTPGDCFVFAGTRARIRARARNDRVGQASSPRRRRSCRAGSGSKDGAVVAARRPHAQADRATPSAASTRRRNCDLVRPLLELQARWSALPDEREWLVGAHRDARRPLPVLLSVRRPARASRSRDAVSAIACRATTPRTLQPDGQRLRLRTAVAGRGRALARRPRPAAGRARRRARHPRRVSTPPSWVGGSSANSRASPAWCSRAIRGSRSRTATCRRRAGSYGMCSPSTIRTICCCAQATRRECSSVNSRRRGSTTALARMRGDRVVVATARSGRRPSRSR